MRHARTAVTLTAIMMMIMTALGPAAQAADSPLAATAADQRVVFAFDALSYNTGGDPYKWYVGYKPKAWTDGDVLSWTNAHWTRWTRHSAKGTAQLNAAGDRGTATIALYRPGYCAALHRRAFKLMRMRFSAWGPDWVSYNMAPACDGKAPGQS
jgi:hypothetical protein